MGSRISLILQAASLLCALCALGAVLLWAPPCAGSLELANGNMAPMRCAYAAKVAALLALVLAVVVVAEMVTKRPMTLIVVLLSAALVLMTFESPLTIGVCKSAEMACQTTAMWLRLCGGISIGAAVAAFAANPNRKRVKN